MLRNEEMCKHNVLYKSLDKSERELSTRSQRQRRVEEMPTITPNCILIKAFARFYGRLP